VDPLEDHLPTPTALYRTVIDIKVDEPVRIYMERYGSEQMLMVVPPSDLMKTAVIQEVDAMGTERRKVTVAEDGKVYRKWEEVAGDPEY
jgi:hypothetical protein